MSPTKALRVGFAKAAEEAMELIFQVQQVEERRQTVSALTASLPGNALLALLEGPLNQFGLMVFDHITTASVVEQMTTGSVLPMAPEERQPSTTDAVMCSDLMDRMLEEFEDQISESPDPPKVHGFRYAARLQEARSIALAFDDVPYRCFYITVKIGRVARESTVVLIFPYDAPPPKRVKGEDSAWGKEFKDVVMGTHVTLDTVLHHMKLSLSEVSAWEEGTLIPIPREALSRVEIRAQDGRKISRGRIGQIGGARAVRIDLTPDDGSNGPLDGRALDLGDLAGMGGMGGMAPRGGDLPSLSNLGVGGSDSEAGLGDMDLGDLPAMGDLPDLDAAGSDLPDLGDLPPLGDLPAMDDLPPLGDMGDFDDLPALGDLPPLGELPDFE
ncbi:FliM/FliN family flagellar motor switch protein [Celeribacter sp.]|uniref:FliM/FliN family flagellar motor switch protein n=1 Tax=Celeribacter sp. TaxID=1890673 RepID=UPI003A8F6B0E